VRELERIEDQLRRSFDGDAFYGPSLWELVRDITAEKAAARPLAGTHSIWEIILHVAAWEGAVRSRIEGGRVELPAEGGWPAIADSSGAEWSKSLAALELGHKRLLQAVAKLTDDRLGELLGTERDRPTGGGVSVYVTLHGIAQHNVYHSGQIAILRSRTELAHE
jgi:uncharacterized damage-inducible protein DinB